MNIFEEVNPKDFQILPLLFTCCGSIFESHPVSIINVNPTKLLENLQEFYRLSWSNDVGIRGALLSLFKFFFDSFGTTVKILCDGEILVDLLSFTPIEDLKSVISVVGCDKAGFEFIKTHRSQIVKPYLEQIWYSEDINDDFDLTKFIFFLFVVKTSTRSVVALLSDDDDDNTVVESGDKSVSLVDLLEKSLDGCGECDEEYLGLMAMKVLIMNLDLLLYLQANHQMQEKLTDLEEQGDRIVDAQRSLRNAILVSLEFVGFFEEIKANEETELQEVPQIFEFLHSTCGDNEFREFLQSGTCSGEFSWLSQARRAFKNSLNTLEPSLLPVLLEQIPKTYVYRKIQLNWPPSDSVYYQLHPEDFSGISLITSFGLKTGLLKLVEDDTHNENLILLIKQSRAFLCHKPEVFSNFDWFVGIIYLVCSGDFDKCKTFLVNVANTQVTSLIWATFGKEFDETLQENFYQHFGVVLEENCSCFQALKMLGIAPEMLVQSWLNQCFFNHLRFEEICNFLTFSVLFPAESLLYYMVAIFQHLNDRICTLTHSLQLTNIFDVTDLSDFKLSNYMTLIETLTKRYRNTHKL